MGRVLGTLWEHCSHSGPTLSPHAKGTFIGKLWEPQRSQTPKRRQGAGVEARRVPELGCSGFHWPSLCLLSFCGSSKTCLALPGPN